MFKRNAGRFNKLVTLLKPSAPVRDELGGLGPTVYTKAVTLLCMLADKDQSRRQVIGDYVTVDTRYFVFRDIRSVVPGLDLNWRLSYNGTVYAINKIELMDESVPYYLQITATAVNSGGGVI